MVIVHIAAISGDMCNGVDVVVPQHIFAQAKLCNLGYININNVKLEGFENQFEYKNDLKFEDLPEPFSKPDLVVFHEAYRPAYLRLSKELRARNIPYVILPHGELSKGAQAKKFIKKKLANLLFFNKFINGARKIQCLSKTEMGSTAFKAEKFISTNGIMIPSTYKDKFSEKGFKFLYIGRLDAYHKGLDLLLQAVKKAKDLFIENSCKLYIYGPDYQGRYKHLEDLIKENEIEDLVSLNHEILKEDKIKEIMSSDVFVQTSRFEGMPMGILEALSYGLPCMASKGTTLGEKIGKADAGWYAGETSDDIAGTFARVIQEKDSLSLKSQKAREFAIENFAWDKIGKSTIEAYREIL